MKFRRMSACKIGSTVVGVFRGDNNEERELIIKEKLGEGEEARVVLHDVKDNYDFEIYRFAGGWCYGSSADRISFKA